MQPKQLLKTDPHLLDGLDNAGLMARIRAKLADGPDGCLLWTGYIQLSYPQIRLTGGGRTWQVRRLLLAETGTVVPKRSEVHNTCGNPRCVAPAHSIVITL